MVDYPGHGRRLEIDSRALARDLRHGAYLHGSFSHRGGSHQTWFESDLVLTRPGILDRCASLLAARVPENTDRLAARGTTAIALATAISLHTDSALLLARAVDLNGASNTGERDLEPPTADRTGEERIVFRGDLFPGTRVVLVEDVILTGTHARESARALIAQGLQVTAVVAVVERGSEGRYALEVEAGLKCSVLFREEDLLR